MDRSSQKEGAGRAGQCHPEKKEVPIAQDLRHMNQNLLSTATDLKCFQSLVDGERPAEETMEHNYLLGDQLLHLQGQYERLLRKQVSQAAYKLEFLLSKLQGVETNEQFKDRRHGSLLKSVVKYNSYHFVDSGVHKEQAMDPTTPSDYGVIQNQTVKSQAAKTKGPAVNLGVNQPINGYK
eukprot:GHVH01011099.1.p1 GENE.GHVH01011099.1~~GHVH01011099.1.p1  ORF type:complete len:180 (+),score=21.85 GHVH01011099.1:112-651(+)